MVSSQGNGRLCISLRQSGDPPYPPLPCVLEAQRLLSQFPALRLHHSLRLRKSCPVIQFRGGVYGGWLSTDAIAARSSGERAEVERGMRAELVDIFFWKTSSWAVAWRVVTSPLRRAIAKLPDLMLRRRARGDLPRTVPVQPSQRRFAFLATGVYAWDVNHGKRLSALVLRCQRASFCPVLFPGIFEMLESGL